MRISSLYWEACEGEIKFSSAGHLRVWFFNILANRWWQSNRCTQITAPSFLHLLGAQTACWLQLPRLQLGPWLLPSMLKTRCRKREAGDLQLLTHRYDVLQRIIWARMLWSEHYTLDGETKVADSGCSEEMASSVASTIGFSGSDGFLQQSQAFPLSAKSLVWIHCLLQNCSWLDKKH